LETCGTPSLPWIILSPSVGTLIVLYAIVAYHPVAVITDLPRA
jgi:hypothetical protein